MEFEKLWGLPAHPLVVHAAVVLLPLAIIATIVAAAAPKLRRYYGPVALGLAIAALLAIGLAQGSGEKLQDQVKETHLVEEHTALEPVDVEHLHRLAGDWQLISDLSFADLLLWVPVRGSEQ